MSRLRLRRQGLFVGLTTLDLIYQVAELPKTNQKRVAADYVMAAGGPVTNAAIAFQHLSQMGSLGPSPDAPPSSLPAFATILSVIGSHPIGQMVQADVAQWGVAIADLNPHHPEPVPTSSIMVTAATGERAVVSLNAVKCVATAGQIPSSVEVLWDHLGVVLIDGHQMEVGEAIASQAQYLEIPVVIDGGSWKPGFDRVLPYATYVICSDNFYPPGCTTRAEVYRFLHGLGIPHIAITHGADPIDYWGKTSDPTASPMQIPVPVIAAADTLGAGDIFHGAFCYYLLKALRRDLPESEDSAVQSNAAVAPRDLSSPDVMVILAQAAQVASTSCTAFGPRQWMQQG